MKVKGFTLIEVLVASLILFIAISTATIVFNGAVKSKQSATSAITTYAYTPILMEHIGVQVRRASVNESKLDGEGYFLGTNYNWTAVVASQAPIKKGPSGESGPNNATRRVLLWNVSLNIRHDNKEQNYEFNITGWVS